MDVELRTAEQQETGEQQGRENNKRKQQTTG
jgi:hypothetical protein